MIFENFLKENWSFELDSMRKRRNCPLTTEAPSWHKKLTLRYVFDSFEVQKFMISSNDACGFYCLYVCHAIWVHTWNTISKASYMV